MTLFDIDKAIETFFEENVDSETGELLNIDQLDELQMAREQKCENIALLIKNKVAERNAVAEQEKAFASRKKSLDNEIDRLKDYLGYALGGEKFSTPKVAVSFRKSESVNITDEYLIPDEYCNISVVRKPDKNVIKDAIKDGKKLMGVEIVEKQNVIVK